MSFSDATSLEWGSGVWSFWYQEWVWGSDSIYWEYWFCFKIECMGLEAYVITLVVSFRPRWVISIDMEIPEQI